MRPAARILQLIFTAGALAASAGNADAHTTSSLTHSDSPRAEQDPIIFCEYQGQVRNAFGQYANIWYCTILFEDGTWVAGIFPQPIEHPVRP